MDPRIPAQYRWRVRRRLMVLRLAHAESQAAASRRYGVDAKTIRRWTQRWRCEGLVGLIPKYPARRPRRIPEPVVGLIRTARFEYRWGAARTQIWLARVHQYRVNTRTIQRVFRDVGMPYLIRARRRRPRQLTLFEKDAPGDSVQVDVKVVKIRDAKAYQCTALDDCTRMRVLRLYPHLNVRSSLDCFAQVQEALPFRIRRVQCDNGAEFPFRFALAVQRAGMRLRYIAPRKPEQNGKVERSHRIDDEEFWHRQRFASLEEATLALRDWEHRYNYERFSLALGGRTPVEKLAHSRHRIRPDPIPSTSEHVPATSYRGRAQRVPQPGGQS